MVKPRETKPTVTRPPTVVSAPVKPESELAALPDDVLEAEVKRRATVRREAAEAAKQARGRRNTDQGDRIAENIDLLLAIFQVHVQRYQQPDCSDAEPQRVDFDFEGIEHRCPRCVLLAIKRQGYLSAWNLTTGVFFRPDVLYPDPDRQR